MSLRWPLARWGRKHGVMSATRRQAILSSTRVGYAGEQAVTLGDLREFVESLEAWPDDAIAETTRGAFCEVSFTSEAPSLIKDN